MKRNKFNLSHYRLLTGDMGELLPCGLMEVLPGDTFQMASSALVRLSPLVAPVMHPVGISLHHWFVPNRLLWDKWEDFITGGEDGLDASVHPVIGPTTPVHGSLADYFGVPSANGGLTMNALPFRAYALIYNEHYRDQDLQAKTAVSFGSGTDATTNTTLKKVNWERDFLTKARPFAQKGAAVALNPSIVPTSPNPGTQATIKLSSTQALAATGALSNTNPSGLNIGGTAVFLDPNGTLMTNITVADLRRSLALQKFAEARARYGSRYSEYLRYLGVTPQDGRLERPEYLGGGRTTVQMSEVMQTAPTTSGSAVGVGDLKGHGIGTMRTNRWRRYFNEHGFVVSLLHVRPKTMYWKGLDKTWTRATKLDYHQRELEGIGQVEVLRREVNSNATTPTAVFGYSDRYDEYRQQESKVHGDFRSTLNYWHMARDLVGEPTLNGAFVECDASKRIHAVQSADVMWCMVNHSVQARRNVGQGAPTGLL